MILPRIFIVSLFATTILPVAGQSFMPFETRYTLFSRVAVEQADDEIFKGLEREPVHVLESNFSIPIRLKNKGVLLIPKISYARYYQVLKLWKGSQNALGNADLFGFNFSGLVPLSKRLSLLGSFGIDQAINENDSWSARNNLHKFGVGVLIEVGQAYKVGISIAYTEVLGLPIPIIIYQRVSRDNRWVADLKLPMSGTLDYNISKNTSFRLEERFNTGGRFALADTKNEVTYYNSTQTTLTLGVKQRITGPVFISMAGGFTLWDRIGLFDQSTDRADVLFFHVPEPVFNFSLFMNIDGKS